MAGPLAGIRIVDLSSVLMGPAATQMLGDMGAEVIKVEALEGDTTRRIGPGRSPEMGSNFLHMNRSKRSVAIDLKHPLSRPVLRRLLQWADVLVHNIRPEAARRLGLGEEDLLREHPRLVLCLLTGFGTDGPYAGQPAYDDLIQGLAGLPSLYARCADVPRYVPTPIADRMAGLHAVVAITGALLHRARTGEGQRVEVPMFETLCQVVLADHLHGQSFVPALGPTGYGRVLSPRRHPYRTADGWICVLIYNDRQWQAFFRLVGRAELAGDPRYATMRARNEHIDELYGMVETALQGHGTAHWLAAFADADIPAGPMNSLDDLLDDPHLQAVDFFQVTEHPTEGTIRTMRMPITWSRSPSEPGRPAPRLGEHSRQVLAELGLSAAEIEALVAEGALRAPGQAAAAPAA